MLEKEVVERCQGHLRLARGFALAAMITADSTECDVRTALSRSYYALFHACRAWLLASGVAEEKCRSHKGVRIHVRQLRGDMEADRLRDIFRLREDSDYRPEFFQPLGDLPRFRAVAETKLALWRTEFDWYLAETLKCTA